MVQLEKASRNVIAISHPPRTNSTGGRREREGGRIRNMVRNKGLKSPTNAMAIIWINLPSTWLLFRKEKLQHYLQAHA